MVELIFLSQIHFKLSLDTELNKHSPDRKTKEIFEKKSTSKLSSSFSGWVFLRVCLFARGLNFLDCVLKMQTICMECSSADSKNKQIYHRISPSNFVCAQCIKSTWNCRSAVLPLGNASANRIRTSTPIHTHSMIIIVCGSIWRWKERCNTVKLLATILYGTAYYTKAAYMCQTVCC